MIDDKYTKTLEQLGITESYINRKVFIFFSLFSISLLILANRLLCILNIFDTIACICTTVIILIFYIAILSCKESWTLYLMNHPFLFDIVIKSKYKFCECDMTKVHIDDLDIDDTLVVSTIRKQYIFSKYIVRIVSVFYVLMFLYTITDIRLFLLTFLVGGEATLFVAAVYVLFSNTLSPLIYNNYARKIESLYTNGFITAKQYKAILFYEGTYLKESNLFSREECVELIDSYIDRTLIATKYMEYSLYKTECKIKYVSFLICFFFILNNINHLLYSLAFIVWYIFYEIIGFIFNKIRANNTCKIKQDVNKYMSEVTRNAVLMNYFIIRNLPIEVLSRV